MAPPPQPTSLEDLVALVDGGAVDTVVLGFPDLYGRLMGKRLDAGFFIESPTGTHACDYLFTVDMEMEVVEGYAFANWAGGYGDVELRADPSTVRVLSWLDRTAFVMCDALDHHGAPVGVAPRTILARQVAALADDDFGLEAASELEYFLYRATPTDLAGAGYRSLPRAGWYVEDYHLLQSARTEDLNGAFRRHLAASGIPVESTKGEAAVGQHELNIRHADVATMADRHVLTKQCVKEVAEGLGASATFMAKPHADEPGSSSHLHVSLWRDGRNVFAGGEDGTGATDEFRWFLGGWITHAADLLACLAPTVNSYKRFQDRSWAPTGLAWSADNRTAAFRVVGHGDGRRIECRLPGADVNPYLAYAAVIAAGRWGIANQVEPPAPLDGDAYAAAAITDAALPRSLADATARLDGSALAREAFGDDVVDHLVHFFATEDAAWRAAVTDWELRRYFERI